MKILITGGTGFIGREFVGLISKSQGVKLSLLVREQSFERASEIYKDIKNIDLIKGDLAQEGILSDNNDLNKLEEIESIVNLGAFYRLDGEESETYRNNIDGLTNFLNFSKKLENLKFFHHISSYVAGDLDRKKITPESLPESFDRFDNYAKSKIKGEVIFKNFDLGNVCKKIYRPAAVLAGRESEIQKIDGPYYITKAIKDFHGLLKLVNIIGYLPLPIKKRSHIPVISVDILAQWLEKCVLHPTKENLRSYHLISGEKFLVADMFKVLFKHQGLSIKAPPK